MAFFGFKGKKKDNQGDDTKQGWFSRLKTGLKKTRGQLSDGLADCFLGKKTIDEDFFDDLESAMLLSDMGVDTTEAVMESFRSRLRRADLDDMDLVMQALQQELLEVLEPCEAELSLEQKPGVILMVGVNGAGKTTTIAKLTQWFQGQGQQVMLAAGDTFRAAAIEQLQVWGERHQVPVVAQQPGSDSASVVFDALHSAKAKGMDLLIADTAGRLHTQSHLMQELAKIKRVMAKVDESAPHEVLLVMDASMGQNVLRQAEQFHQEIGLTGLVMTKLDGTAKGGVVFAVAKKLKLPIYFIGVGEQADDLRPFVAEDFVRALFEDIDLEKDQA